MERCIYTPYTPQHTGDVWEWFKGHRHIFQQVGCVNPWRGIR